MPLPDVFFLEITPTPKTCPYCDVSMWMSVSGFIRVDEKTWSAKSVCYACKNESIWRLNPDIPLDQQKLKLNKLFT